MAGNLSADSSQSNSIVAVKQVHLLGLDTVRAFAALSVMFAHILGPRLPDMLHGLGVSQDLANLSRYIFTGLPAVIVFFVVSGFCIHFPYTRRPLPVVAFTVARWTRIMIPALSAMLLAKLMHLTEFNFIDGFILWSIVCELWYYSLYPFFLFISRKVSFEAQFALAFLVSIALVSYLGSDKYGNMHIYGLGLNWLIALPSWLLGCLLANRVSAKNSPTQYGRRDIIIWRAVVATTASCLYWLTLNTPVGYYLTMNTFALLVFFWIYAEINSQKSATSVFERVGKWSYSIYLFHIVWLTCISYLFVRAGFPQTPNQPWITIPIILWLCYQVYKYVEKPSHELARKLFGSYRNQFQRMTVAQYKARPLTSVTAGKSR